MRMAGSISQTLIRTTSTSSRLLKSVNLVPALRFCYYSTNTHFSIVSLIPDVADSSSSPSSSSSSISPESEALVVRIIEDAVHRIIVNRSAPEWLPLVPGASYWVPPKRRNYGVAQLLRRLSNSPLDPDQLMSLTTSRAWPSSAYYLPNTQVTNGGDGIMTQTHCYTALPIA